MKERELRKIAKCGICGKKIGESGLPFFFRLKVEQFVIDTDAFKRQVSLGKMTSPAVAMVMGKDDDLAVSVDVKEMTVCANCATENIAIADIVQGD